MNYLQNIPQFYVNTFEHNMQIFMVSQDSVVFSYEGTIGSQLIEFLETSISHLSDLAYALYEDTKVSKKIDFNSVYEKNVKSQNIYIRYYEIFLVSAFASIYSDKKGISNFIDHFKEDADYFVLKERLYKNDIGKIVVDAMLQSFCTAQGHISDCMDFSLKPSFDGNIEKLAPMQRLYFYETWLLDNHKMPYMFIPREYATTLFKNKAIERKNSDSLEDMAIEALNCNVEVYEITICKKIYQMLRYEMIKIISNKAPVKPCKNCGKYFIPHGRSNIEYCSRPIADQPGKNCSHIGAMAVHKQKVQNDPVLSEYSKAYKRMTSRARFGDIEMVSFTAWLDVAKEFKARYQSGDLDSETFIDWLNSDRKYKKRT